MNPICACQTEIVLKERGAESSIPAMRYWMTNGILNMYITDYTNTNTIKRFLRDEKLSCGICLEDGVDDDKNYRKGLQCPDCSMWLCLECYDKWFVSNFKCNMIPTCPGCRKPMPDSTGNYILKIKKNK